MQDIITYILLFAGVFGVSMYGGSAVVADSLRDVHPASKIGLVVGLTCLVLSWIVALF